MDTVPATLLGRWAIWTGDDTFTQPIFIQNEDEIPTGYQLLSDFRNSRLPQMPEGWGKLPEGVKRDPIVLKEKEVR